MIWLLNHKELNR